MKAAAIDRFGPASVLTLHTLPVPEVGPDEVLIELHAAGVGVWDTDIRGGWWPKGRPKFPLVLGSDGAGVIAAKGARVRKFALNERVWACDFINPKGGFTPSMSLSTLRTSDAFPSGSISCTPPPPL